MFNKNKQEQDLDRSLSNSTRATIICSDTTFVGDITSSNDIRIDGTIKGNIDCTAKVIVGTHGVIEGDITSMQADVMGKVNGNIRAKELLYLRDECNLTGNIYATKLHIDPTVTFNGACHMGANVIELASENQPENLKKTKAASV